MATFRHKTIRSFRVGKYQFKNNLLSIPDEIEAEKFRKLVGGDPDRGIRGIRRVDQNNIVEIDEDAMRKLEKRVGQTVIKGVDNTGRNLTPGVGGIQRPVATQQPEAITGLEQPPAPTPSAPPLTESPDANSQGSQGSGGPEGSGGPAESQAPEKPAEDGAGAAGGEQKSQVNPGLAAMLAKQRAADNGGQA